MHETLRLQQEKFKLKHLSIKAADGTDNYTSRLFVRDKCSGLNFLVDTGAEVSVVPPGNSKDVTNNNTLQLFAVNGSKIKTYGEKLLQVDFGLRRVFKWKFIVADVGKPIIGADFLRNFNLVVNLGRKCLQDNITKLTVSAVLVDDRSPTLSTVYGNTPFHKLLVKYIDITKPQQGLVHLRHSVTHHIVTNGPPISARVRRLPPDKLKAAKSEFEFMVEQGICRPSKSCWSNPLHMVKKSNGEWRPCGDYRKLNSVTVPDRYPVPFLHDFTHILANKKIFSSIDLTKAYYQIPVETNDIPKTAIATPFGLFEFLRMPFGLCNAAQSFQRFINQVISGLDFCFAYIDDVLIASEDLDSHLKHLEQVFLRFKENGLTINVSKSVFGKNQLKFLGHLISEKGVTPLPDKVEAVLKQQEPTTVKELQRFLGMVNFYRSFIPHAAEIQGPLYELLKGKTTKEKKILWSEISKQAFNKTKESLANATLLTYPLANAQLSLMVDASDTGIGAVVQQYSRYGWEPLGFFSRTLNKAQRKYSTYDRELLAAYAAVKYFHFILEGRPFILYTDHKPLIYAFRKKQDNATPRQLRQLDYISQFTTDIRHISGSKNIIADNLSRIETINFPNLLDYVSLAKDQSDDIELQRLLDHNSSSLILKKISLPNSDVTLYCDISTEHIRPYITPKFRRQVFQNYHNLNHPSVRGTVNHLRTKFVWPSILKDLREWSRSCIFCQKNKISRHVSSPLGNFAVPNERFTHINIDIIGPLHPSLGFTYCVTCIDRFTRWPEAFPVPDIRAETIARAFYNGWVCRFGTPEKITTDQGRQFEADLFKCLTNILGIERIRTTSYHPQANGLVERWHRALKSAIRCHEDKGWAEALPTVLLGFRSVLREDLNATSSELVYGTPIRLPGEFLLEPKESEKVDIFLQKLKSHFSQVRPVPTSHHGYKPTFIFKDLKICDYVFVRQDLVKSALKPPYDGPFKVIERSPKNFKINIRGEDKVISIDRIKPAYILREEEDNFTRSGRRIRLPVRFQDSLSLGGEYCGDSLHC